MINGLVWILFEYSLCLIELIFLYMFLGGVTKIKEKLPKYAIYILLAAASTIIFCLTWISIFSAFKMIIGYGICLAVTIIITEAKLRVKLFWGTLYYVGIGLIDIVSISLIAFILKIDIVTIALTTNWYRIILSAFAKLVLYIFIKFIGRKTQKSLSDVPIIFWQMIVGVFTISLICIIAVIEIGILLTGNELAGLFLVIISLGILILCITFYQVFQYICNYFEKAKQYEMIEYQNAMMIQATLERDESHKEIRKIWHDFNNHISCIDMLLQMEHVKRARDYIADMKINSEKISLDIKTGNEIADAVINQKYLKAKQQNIDVSVKGFIGEDMGINAVDLCALMSNALDNAIEATSKIDNESEVSKKIEVKMKPYKDYMLIEIINTVKERVADIESFKTTKNDKTRHGFGMLNMKKIVEKYDGYLQYFCEENTVNLSIMLKVVNE